MNAVAPAPVSAALPMVLGVAWGIVAILPFTRGVRRSRARDLTARSSPPTRARRLVVACASAPVLRVVPRTFERRRGRRAERIAARELPVVTDLLRVAIGAGANPSGAVALAEQWAPPVAAARLHRIAELMGNGASLDEAMRTATRGRPGWAPIVDALSATDRLGAPIGPALERVSSAQRAELRRAAEAHARRVPVRLLFPLVFLVLPAFGLLTVVPVLVDGLTSL